MDCITVRAYIMHMVRVFAWTAACVVGMAPGGAWLCQNWQPTQIVADLAQAAAQAITKGNIPAIWCSSTDNCEDRSCSSHAAGC